jgi:hypothetical protein
MALSVSAGSLLKSVVADRSGTDAALAVSAAWIGFVMALLIFEPGMGPSVEMVIAALSGAGLILVGFAAVSRVRPMSKREGSERLRLLGWSLSLGALMSLINLGVNLGLLEEGTRVRRVLGHMQVVERLRL